MNTQTKQSLSGTTKNLIKAKLTDIAQSERGMSFNQFVWNNNRKKLIQYVKDKQNQPETELNNSDLDHFRDDDGKLDNHCIERAF
jgi:hypothetical protein